MQCLLFINSISLYSGGEILRHFKNFKFHQNMDQSGANETCCVAHTPLNPDNERQLELDVCSATSNCREKKPSFAMSKDTASDVGSQDLWGMWVSIRIIASVLTKYPAAHAVSRIIVWEWILHLWLWVGSGLLSGLKECRYIYTVYVYTRT